MNIGAAGREVERRRWEGVASYVFLAVLTVMAAAYCVRIFQISLDNEDRLDFSHYYTSSYLLRHGIDPYANDLVAPARKLGFVTPEVTHASNPPALVLLMEPLTLFRPHVAYWIWFAINVASLAGFFALAMAEFDIGLRLEWALVCLTLIFPPLANHFHYAQAQIVILLALMLTMRFLREGRDCLAGAAVAFACLIKVFPIFMVGYFLARRRWRALAWTGAWIALGAVLTVTMTGFAVWESFVRASREITSPYWLVRSVNLSLNGFITRAIAFAVMSGASRRVISLIRPAVALAELGLFGVTLFASSRAPRNEIGEATAFSVWMVATIVLAPTAWPHYLVLLLIPLWLTATQISISRAGRAALWTAAGSYFATYVVRATLQVASTRNSLDEFALVANQISIVPAVLAYIAEYCTMRDERLVSVSPALHDQQVRAEAQGGGPIDNESEKSAHYKAN